MGPKAGLDECGKSRPNCNFVFVFSCTLYFIRICVFCLIVLYFAFLSLLTTHNTNIHAQAGFEPAIPAGKRPQTYAVDRAATGIGKIRSPDRPAGSESLYRLRSHGPLVKALSHTAEWKGSFYWRVTKDKQGSGRGLF